MSLGVELLGMLGHSSETVERNESSGILERKTGFGILSPRKEGKQGLDYSLMEWLS